MSENPPPDSTESSTPAATPVIHVAPSPHLSEAWFNTRGMMIDVLAGLVPVMLMSIFVFGWYAVVQVGLCVLSCLAAEALLSRMRGKPIPVGDYSAVVTGVILGLSLPWSADWYIGVIGSVVAIGLGKTAFGGLGANVFNPAMVGRAFVLLSFPRQLGASAYLLTDSHLEVLTQATPLTAAKQLAAQFASGEMPDALGQVERFWPLFIGQVNGSLGETSALAVLIGGIFLCVRRAAAWQIPAGMLLAGFASAALGHWAGLTPISALNHLMGGSFLLGAFFVATDPVSSPLTQTGKLIFGLGIGLLTIVIRLFSGYPEGVMFAVLLMNAAVPLLNRWTVPRPLGGPAPTPT